MKTIYFTGKAGDGKTAAALGIGLKLREKGLKVSYFKPLGFQKGIAKKEDDDVLLMREVFELPSPATDLPGYAEPALSDRLLSQG